LLLQCRLANSALSEAEEEEEVQAQEDAPSSLPLATSSNGVSPLNVREIWYMEGLHVFNPFCVL